MVKGLIYVNEIAGCAIAEKPLRGTKDVIKVVRPLNGFQASNELTELRQSTRASARHKLVLRVPGKVDGQVLSEVAEYRYYVRKGPGSGSPSLVLLDEIST